MTYGSVCSGIEAATVAWGPLGWRPKFFAEIEPFPSAVLDHHYPGVPNLGDFTKIGADDVPPVDLLVAGTPCQDFSVAGKRLGIRAPRGNLALEFLALAARLRPRWVVFENVPGLLQNWSGAEAGDLEPGCEREADENSDFAAFLGAVRDCGYLGCWRVLDAQYAGLAQRRKRVFFVGYLGDWRPPAAVLLEPASLLGYSSPGREAGKGPATAPAGGPEDGGRRGTTSHDVSQSLLGKADSESYVAEAFGGNDTRGPIDVATAQNAHGGPHGRCDFESETLMVHALRAEGFDGSEDGTGRGTPVIPILEAGARTGKSTDDPRAGIGVGELGDPMFSLQAGKQHAVTANIRASSGGSSRSYVSDLWAVRRLTPRECERLQGFPDDYTLIKIRGRLAADGPRYRALGNSMAVPVMRGIGERIALVDGMIRES